MDKLKMHSPNLTDDNIAKIAELFPNCITEVKAELRIDTDKHGLEEEKI